MVTELKQDSILPSGDVYVRREQKRHVYVYTSNGLDPSVPTYIHYNVRSLPMNAFSRADANLYVKENMILHPGCFSGMKGSLHFAAGCRAVRPAVKNTCVHSIAFAEGTTTLDNFLLCNAELSALMTHGERLRTQQSVQTVTLPASLQAVGVASLATVRITVLDLQHSSVTSIGSYAFSHCYALTRCGLPATLVEIGSHTFYMCTRLQQIDMSMCRNVAVVPEAMASHCHRLTDVVLPPNAVVIKDHVFAYCKTLKTIVVPASVQYIANAFLGCDALHTIFTQFVPQKCAYVTVFGALATVVSNTACAGDDVWVRNVEQHGRFVYKASTSKDVLLCPQKTGALTGVSPWAWPPPCCALFAASAFQCASLHRVDERTLHDIEAAKRTAFTHTIRLPPEIVDKIFHFVGRAQTCYMPYSSADRARSIWLAHLPQPAHATE
jgi:hypothetical protein